MSAKPIKPRRMFVDTYRSTPTALAIHATRKAAEDFEFHGEGTPARPVLVIDLSPESILELARKLAIETFCSPGTDLASLGQEVERHLISRGYDMLASLGIRPTKGRK